MTPRAGRRAKLLAPIIAALALLMMPSGASALDFGKVKGWWPLNEGRGQTVRDWSGYRNHGILGSTPSADAHDPSWIKGIFWGSGLHFGGDDFVQIPASRALEPAQFTLSLWARAPQSPGQFSYLLAKGSNECVAASYGLWTSSNGGIEFYIYEGSNLVRSGSAPAETIWDGRWHNLSATYDGSRARLYLDGKSLGEPVGSPNPIVYDQADGTATIGGYRGTCDLLFNGDMDEVMMFDKVLPIEQIWSRWGFILGRPTLAG
jgi:hypothetical protein